MNQLAPWNDERVEIISQQWREGRSAGQIARSLGGTSRNAVIGKLHRLGLLGRARPTPPGKPKGGRPKGSSRVPSLNLQSLLAAKALAGKALPKLPVSSVVVDVTNAKPWLERAYGECAYPVSGEGADTFSCCNPSQSTYCPGHQRVMFRPAPNSTDRLVKWGVRFAA